MIDGYKLYEAHRTAFFEFTGKWLPHWDCLTWRERDQWEQTADEVNSKDRTEVH